jgi:hypothetical protein
LKSFISIFLIISCIAVISLKDTLRSIHSLLHHIPNPFHNHSHVHHHDHGHGHHSHHSGDEHGHTHRADHHSKDQHHIHHHSSEGQDHYSESSHDEKAVKEVQEGDNLAHDHDVLEHFGLKNQKEESASGGRKKGEKKSFKFQWYPGVYYQYDFNLNESLSGTYFSGSNNFFLIYNQGPPSPPPEYTLL